MRFLVVAISRAQPAKQSEAFIFSKNTLKNQPINAIEPKKNVETCIIRRKHDVMKRELQFNFVHSLASLIFFSSLCRLAYLLAISWRKLISLQLCHFGSTKGSVCVIHALKREIMSER